MKLINKVMVISFAILTIFSCLNDDEDLNNKSHFTPPTWIHGKWGALQEPQLYEFRFDYNNFYLNSGGEISYNELINSTNSSGQDKMIVEEEFDRNSYFFTISSNSTKNQFKFKKVSQSKIIYIYNGVDIELFLK